MRMFLRQFTEPVKIPAFSSMWLLYSYGFLIIWEYLDGFTTKIGLDLGLTEVGIYAKVVLSSYGFWGLMAWKYSVIALLGAMYFLIYYTVKKYDPQRLKLVTIILSIGCLVAGVATAQVVISNIHHIGLALNYY
jgi:hypothetical protein